MGYYRPRPTEVRLCKHCAVGFETNHKRAMYCGDSCRVLAHKARQQAKSAQLTPVPEKSELSFSVQNVGTTAAGASVVALGNYLLNDRPTNQRLEARLARMEQNSQRNFDQLNERMHVFLASLSPSATQDPALTAAYASLEAARQGAHSAEPLASPGLEGWVEWQLAQKVK